MARAASQRLSRAAWLTRVRPRLRSSCATGCGLANRLSRPSVIRPSPRSAQRARARSNATAFSSPRPRQGSRSAITQGQRDDVGQAQVQTLAGQRVHHVRRVAKQHQPAPHQASACAIISSQAARSAASVSSAGRAAGGFGQRLLEVRPRQRQRCVGARVGQRPNQRVRATGLGASIGRSASTSGERNHCRARFRCGASATSRVAMARWP